MRRQFRTLCALTIVALVSMMFVSAAGASARTPILPVRPSTLLAPQSDFAVSSLRYTTALSARARAAAQAADQRSCHDGICQRSEGGGPDFAEIDFQVTNVGSGLSRYPAYYKVVLLIDGAFNDCRVYINNIDAGDTSGGMFSFPLTSQTFGRHMATVVLAAASSPDDCRTRAMPPVDFNLSNDQATLPFDVWPAL